MRYLSLFLALIVSTIVFAQSVKPGNFDILSTNNPANAYIQMAKDLKFNSTGAIYMPKGTTGQRPGFVQDGALRFNSTLAKVEVYNGGTWSSVGGGLSSWATATAYNVGDVVIQNNLIYKCLIAHTSGTFATDLAAGDWVKLSALPAYTVNQILFGDGTDIPIANTEFQFSPGTKALSVGASSTSSNGIINVGGSGTGTGTINGGGGSLTIAAGPTTIKTNSSGQDITFKPNNTTALTLSGTNQQASFTGQISSSVTTGTAPLVVASTTKVTNLYSDRAALADTVTTNANLSGDVSSVGNVTTIGAGKIFDAMVATNAAISFSKLGTLSTGQVVAGNAGTASAVTMSGGATIGATGVVTLGNTAVTGQQITGYSSGAGTVAATDTILQAIQKLNGNDALKQPLATLTTKGDMYVATGASTVVRQGVGADDLVLTADSTATNGVSYKTAKLSLKGQSEGSPVQAYEIDAPYNQMTTTGTNIRLLQTGNENMLANPNFEGQFTSGVANGWTNSSTGSTPSVTTVSSEISSGLQAQKIALSSGVLNFSQSVSTPTGMQTQGVVGGLYKVPSNMTDFQVCSLVNGAEKTCVPSANLILDNLYHAIEIPEVITPGQSFGIKFKTTSSYTGNVFFDASYVKQGLGTQNLMLDNVYSANITTTSGAMSNLNKAGWISGCTAANQTVCTLNGFTVAPNCTATLTGGGSSGLSVTMTTISASSISVYTWNTSSGAAAASQPFTLTCQKAGNDYLNSSANAYVANSANYSRRAYTPTLTGFGTVTNVECYEARENEYDVIDCKFTTGTPTAVEARASLPGSNVAQTFTQGIRMAQGMWCQNSTATSIVKCAPMLIESGSSYLTFGNDMTYANATSPLAKMNGNVVAGSQIVHFTARVPIQGWTNANYIVGSFQDVLTSPGAGLPKLYTASVTTTSGAIASQLGSWLSSCTAANPTVCTIAAGKFTAAPYCWASLVSNSAVLLPVTGTTSTSVTVRSILSSSGADQASIPFNVFCFGI